MGQDNKVLGIQSDGRLAICPGSPNCVCTAHPDDQAHFVSPLKFQGDMGATQARLKQLILGLPRSELKAERPGYLHFEFTSKLMRFVDDLEVSIGAEQGVIHLRSASRVGYSDFGVNQRRVDEIRRLWENPT